MLDKIGDSQSTVYSEIGRAIPQDNLTLTAMHPMETRPASNDELHKGEFRFRLLTESLPHMVWTCHSDGRCDYLSPQWLRYTGTPMADQLDHGWLNQIHPEDRVRTAAASLASVRDGQPFQYEYRLRRCDGLYRWFDTRGTPLRDTENRIIKWFGACTDIDERKQIEADQLFLLQLSSDLQSSAAAMAERAVAKVAKHFQADRCSLHSVEMEHDLVRQISEYSRSGQANPPPSTS